jgi:hypothetical protein
MDENPVDEQEREIEKASAEVVTHLGLKTAAPASQKSMHLMAKAAVAVHEAEWDSGEYQNRK